MNLTLAEKSEVDAAVASMLQEAGMGGEVVLLAVLEDEDAALLQEIAAEHEVGNLSEAG